VYGLYTIPTLEMVMLYNERREALVFICTVPTCRHKVNIYTSNNVGSTGNLRKHVVRCRGQQRLDEVDEVGKASLVRSAAAKADGSIASAFKRVGKDKISYSTRPLTEKQMRYAPALHPSRYSDAADSVSRLWPGAQRVPGRSASSRTKLSGTWFSTAAQSARYPRQDRSPMT